MEDAIIQLLEKFFYRKIMLYNDLLHCFMKEREFLINIDLDELWNVSKVKEEIFSKIKSIRQEIISITDPTREQKTFDPNQILDLIPGKNKNKFHELYRTLIKLKSEVDLLRKENMLLIDDSLHFLDEMVSIITGESRSKIMYNKKCDMPRYSSNILLNREA